MMGSKLLMVVGLGLALAACGGGDDGGAAGPDSGAAERCTEQHSMCITLHVPADFAGTPRQIMVGLFDELPPQGPPPGGIATVIDAPEIGIGTPYVLTAEDINIDNPDDYYLYVVLYIDGGGQFVPEPGIDYITWTDSKVHVGDGPVNMPDMTFGLAE